jgi:hypothetical protein
MSIKEAVAGSVFVFTATFTLMLVMAIGVMWWENYKDRHNK